MSMKDSMREVAAGAFAGAISKTAMAPLDRLKLVVQLRGSLGDKGEVAYAGPWTAFRRMIQEEGFFALWRGNVSTVVIQAGTSSLNFLFMDWYKRAAVDLVGKDHHFVNSFVSAGLGGATAMTLMYPVGLARTKLALDVGKEHRKFPRGMRDVFRYSVATNGITSLYKGYGVALASVSLYRMVHLGGYDYIKSELFRRDGLALNSDASEISFRERFVAAQFVSITASTVHYPLDSVRRRLMMQSDAKTAQYKNAVHCFTQIYKQEGIAGYYRGLGTTYLRSIGGAFLLVSYDFCKSMLQY